MMAARPNLTEIYGQETEMSRDRTGRFSDDAELRRHGYKIHSRPPAGSPLWEKDGKVVEERVALLRVEKEIRKMKGE